MPKLSLLPTSITPWLVLAVMVFILLRVIYHNFLSSLSKIPSIHWSVRWTRCHMLYTKYFYGVRHAYYNAHINQAGSYEFQPLLRTGPNEVSIMTTSGVQTVFGGGFDRSPWYDVFSNFGLVEIFSPLLCYV